MTDSKYPLCSLCDWFGEFGKQPICQLHKIVLHVLHGCKDFKNVKSIKVTENEQYRIQFPK